MIIALAAAPVDFKQFEWYTNNGGPFKFDPGNNQHVMRVEKGDLIGLKKTTRGPTAGSFQVVLAKYPHLIFRSIPLEAFDKQFPKFTPYKGIPVKPEKTGLRHARVKIKGADAHDKQTALKYKPEGKIKEEGEYDKANYQWREIVNGPIPVATMHHGKVRQPLKKGDVVGLRFMTSARGGFVIMPNGERVNISETTYESITSGARILPHADQQVGIVVLEDIKHQLPKRARIAKPKPEKPLEFEEGEEGMDEDAQARRGKHFLNQHKELVSDFEYEEDDEDEDWEDEDEDFEEEPEEEPEENVNTEEARYVEEGMILQLKNGSKLVVVGVEEAGLSDKLYLYNQETSQVRVVKVATGIDVKDLPEVTLVGNVSETELANMQRRASRYLNKKA